MDTGKPILGMDATKEFDPDQPRDENGRWSAEGGSSSGKDKGDGVVIDHDNLEKSLATAMSPPDLDKSLEKIRTAAAKVVVGNLSNKAKDKLRSCLVIVRSHYDLDGVEANWIERFGSSGHGIVAFYDSKKKMMAIDGGTESMDDYALANMSKEELKQHSVTGTLAHELGHAIDRREKVDTRKKYDPDNVWEYSQQKDFLAAWKSEICDTGKSGLDFKLSEYATTEPQEGFAELCRLIYSDKNGASVAKKKLPKCYAFMVKNGLVR